YSAKNDLARAIADFDRALAVAPDNKAAQDRRRTALAVQAEMARTGAPPAATGVAPSAPVQTAPVNGPVQKLVADPMRLLSQGKRDDALVLLDRALTLDPKSAPALKLRMAVHLQQNQRPQAIADLDKLIALEPKDASLPAARGMLLATSRQFEAALADF